MIWTPELDRPSVNEDAVDFLVGAFLDNTPPVVIDRARRQMRSDQPTVDTYVRGFARLVADHTDTPWAYRAAVAGASIAGMLYEFSGYWPDVDEASFGAAATYIAEHPMPEVFDVAVIADPTLVDIIELSAPLIASDYEPEGIEQSMRLGAGCVRVLYGHALKAA